MSDKILLQNMMFYGFHGVHEYEREQGQKFYLDVELTLDLTLPGKSDNVIDTIDYTVIYANVKEIMENHRFQLLEAAGAHIAEVILKNTMVCAVTVRIRKPSAPIPGSIDCVQVEINRSR